jgi:tetratricopeptide (TPR) repeat protein
MGYVYNDTKRYDEAVHSFKQAIKLQPSGTLPYPWYGLGVVYRSMGRHDKAIAAYQKAIELDPKDAFPWNGLGDVYSAMGHHDEALAAYQKAIELKPKNAILRTSLAACLRKAGLDAEYRKHLSKAREMIAEENQYARACFEAVAGNVDDALTFLRTAFEKKQISTAWAQRDPDLEFIRDDPCFQRLVAEASRR